MNTNNKKLSLLQNWISVIGGILSVFWFSIAVVLLILDIKAKEVNPYLGVVTYLIIPILLFSSLLLIPLGAWLERKKRRESDYVQRFPTIDFNNPVHQQRAYAIIGVVTALLLFSVIGGYRAYEFTESVRFCGMTCHSVMKPEYITYQHSPHARVACVHCHIGPGVGWFVRSKLSGSYQVYSVLFKKYHRPIETPVKNLRPAQETCEQCHWPAKFFGAKQKVYMHYLSDEKNSPWQIQMLIKVGGGDTNVGSTMGIHWHMDIKNSIEYIASDEKREVIPWVRSTDPQGHVTEYMTTDKPLTPEELVKAQIRRLDCIDCHNRPSHIFHDPNNSVDQAFAVGRLDLSLPYLKQKAVELLTGKYPNEGEAEKVIGKGLIAYYRDKYPDVFEQKSVAIREATEEISRIYKTNFFPEMKTDWLTHPDHLGHMTSDGCFRCHDGMHKSRDGKVITNDCNTCHTFLAQGSPDEVAKMPLSAQPFRHPVDVGMDVTEEKCTVCHTGAN